MPSFGPSRLLAFAHNRSLGVCIRLALLGAATSGCSARADGRGSLPSAGSGGGTGSPSGSPGVPAGSGAAGSGVGAAGVDGVEAGVGASVPMSGASTGSAGDANAALSCFGPWVPKNNNYCDLSLCGNGRRDSCVGPPGCVQAPMGASGSFGGSSGMGAPPPCLSVPEPCDGTDLGGLTCESLGFAGGGTLTCSADCTLDVIQCALDAPVGPHIAATETLAGARSPSNIQLAANDTAVVVSWNDRVGTMFRILDPNLNPVWAPTAPLPETGMIYAIAPSPSGWVVARAKVPPGFPPIAGSSGPIGPLVIDTIDNTGAVVATINLGVALSQVSLTAQPGGGPLLAWVDPSSAGGMVQLAVIAPDGKTSTPPVSFDAAIFSSSVRNFSGVFVGGAFLLTFSFGSGNDGVGVARVLPAGTVDGSLKTVVPQQQNSANAVQYNDGQIVADASGNARLTVVTCSEAQGCNGPPTVQMVTIDPYGAIVSALAPVTIPTQGSTWAFGSAMFGATMAGVVSISDNGGNAGLSLVEVNSAGMTTLGPVPIVAEPGFVGGFVMAKRGPEIVVAWAQDTQGCERGSPDYQMGIARIVP